MRFGDRGRRSSVSDLVLGAEQPLPIVASLTRNARAISTASSRSAQSKTSKPAIHSLDSVNGPSVTSRLPPPDPHGRRVFDGPQPVYW